MSWFYYVASATMKTLLRLLTRWEVRGKENIPRQGPLLVVANHLNLADPPLVSVSLGRKAIFMAKEELFRSKFSGYFIRGFGAFPINRGRLDRKALSQAEKLLADGWALVMFPEGARSKNTQLQPAFPGSALVAIHSCAPILPVGISGTESIKGIGWLLRRPRLTVNIGPAFHLPPLNSRVTKEELAQFTSLIMGHIAELLPSEYRGHYAKQGKN